MITNDTISPRLVVRGMTKVDVSHRSRFVTKIDQVIPINFSNVLMSGTEGGKRETDVGSIALTYYFITTT